MDKLPYIPYEIDDSGHDEDPDYFLRWQGEQKKESGVIEVSHLSEVRISSASFARICDERGRFLLLVNKSRAKKGEIVLTPIGGALEADEEGLRKLQEDMGVDPKSFEKGSDLRFKIEGKKANQYRKWFLSRTNREIDPGRELKEELIDEEGLLIQDDVQGVGYQLAGYETELQQTTRPGQEGQTTLRLLEIYDTRLQTEIMVKLQDLSRISESKIFFVTEEEIKNGRTENGIEIATVSITLLDPKKTISEFK